MKITGYSRSGKSIEHAHQIIRKPDPSPRREEQEEYHKMQAGAITAGLEDDDRVSV